jgi:hypothetical protein
VNHNLEMRLRKLESRVHSAFKPWCRVIGSSEEECESKRRGMIEAGQAEEADNFVFRVLVAPRAASHVRF